MAEFVEFRCEEWVTELEQLEKIRLLEPKEVKSLVTKRREFEYKIERRSKSKEDFLRYIQFEVDFLRIVNTRRKKTGVKTNKREIEHKQVNRIVKLFKKIIFRYPDDIKLWMSLFKFCEDVKEHSVVSKMLVRMLQIHSNKPDLWIFAAKWEMEHEKSVDNSRQFLTKGLRHHPSSEELYLELFKLELEHMKKKINLKERKMKLNKWESDEVVESIIDGKVVEVVYKSAVNVIDNVDFKINLINACDEVPRIQTTILKDLMETHVKEEKTWDAIAKLEYRGISCNWKTLSGGPEAMEVENSEGEEEEEEEDASNIRIRIQRCVAAYKEAVKRFDTAKMWNFYLDHIIDVYDTYSSAPTILAFLNKKLQEAMEGALKSGHMAEDYFQTWIDTLEKSDKTSKRIGEVCERGLEKYPRSLQLWHSRLRYHLAVGDEKKGREVFREAVTAVVDSPELWQLMVEYYRLKGSPDVEKTFEEGIQRGGEVAKFLKPVYLDWLVQTKGIEEARRVFDTTVFQYPPSLDLYNAMCKLESSQATCSKSHVRKCYESACSYFGRDDPNIWLDYVKWELTQGDVTKVSQIHRRALSCLTSEKTDEFLERYNFVKMEGPS